MSTITKIRNPVLKLSPSQWSESEAFKQIDLCHKNGKFRCHLGAFDTGGFAELFHDTIRNLPAIHNQDKPVGWCIKADGFSETFPTIKAALKYAATKVIKAYRPKAYNKVSYEIKLDKLDKDNVGKDDDIPDDLKGFFGFCLSPAIARLKNEQTNRPAS